MIRALFLASTCAISACAAGASPVEAGRASMLPPEVARQFETSILEGFNERPLWIPEASRGYRERIRFTIAGILYTRMSIRIDESLDGSLRGHIAIHRRRDRIERDDVVRHRFRVSRDEFEALQRDIQQARLWTIYPQFWGMADFDSICFDGMELVFERVDATGYRFATANAQCTAPPAVKRVAETFVDIAGVPHARNWLY
jgi:hypothetical protein